MAGQHEPPWKPEAPEWQAPPAPHAAPNTMPPMPRNEMQPRHNTMAYRRH